MIKIGGLTVKQYKALTALAHGSTQQQAAAAAKVSRKTIVNWLSDTEFKSALKKRVESLHAASESQYFVRHNKMLGQMEQFNRAVDTMRRVELEYFSMFTTDAPGLHFRHYQPIQDIKEKLDEVIDERNNHEKLLRMNYNTYLTAVREAEQVLAETEARAILGEVEQTEVDAARAALESATRVRDGAAHALDANTKAQNLLNGRIGAHVLDAIKQIRADVEPAHKAKVAKLLEVLPNLIELNDDLKAHCMESRQRLPTQIDCDCAGVRPGAYFELPQLFMVGLEEWAYQLEKYLEREQV